MARTYKRDSRGRFASNGSVRSAPKARLVTNARAMRGGSKGKTLKRGRAQLAEARGKVRTAKGKLAAFDPADQTTKSSLSKRAQRGAVTKAEKRLATVKRTAVIKARRMIGTIGKPKGLKPGELKAGPKTSQTTSGGQKRNIRAERAKAAANRTGIVSGKKFTHGQDVKTMSLAELRTAVRQQSRKGGTMNRKDFVRLYALPAGVVNKGKGGREEGRMPRTRGDWEKIYRNTVGVPQAERNRKSRPGVINGIDIHKNFRPRAVFGLGSKTVTKDDVNRAYRRLARQVHPDAGGRRKDFERLTKMRDSMLAMVGSESSSKGKGKRSKKGAATPAAAPSGPRLLPPARGGESTGRSRRRR